MESEATYVDVVGKGRPFQCGAHADHVIPALREMADAVHAAGGRVSVELAHCGRQVDARITGFQPVAPSAVPCALSGGYVPRALAVGEIADIVERFAAAARRVVEAGLDAVEIHGASGYLPNAFLSPYANLREDAYGGSLENRIRAPLEVVAAIRAEIGPDVPLLYRMTGDDGVGAGGLEVAESALLAAALERAGVDLIDVSAGNLVQRGDGSRVPGVASSDRRARRSVAGVGVARVVSTRSARMSSPQVTRLCCRRAATDRSIQVKPVHVGLRGFGSRVVAADDTAAAFGHAGVDVVATTRVILWIEQVAHAALLPYLDDAEVTVGAHVDVRHLLPTRIGETVEVEVVVTEVTARKVVFDAVASSSAGVVMRGVHARGVVQRSAFAS